MADAAAAPATSTAPAAPAAPPAAATPPPTPEPAKPDTPAAAPSATKTTEKLSAAKRIAEAAKILQQAGSAKESGAPAASDTTPTGEGVDDATGEKPGDDDKPRDVQVAEWRKYKQLKGKVEKRAAELELKAKEYESRDLRYQQWDQRIGAFLQREQLLKTDPKGFLDFVIKESGSDYASFYEKLANIYIDQGKPEARVAANEREMQELKQQLARERQQIQQQQLAAQNAQLVTNFFAVAATESHPSVQMTLKRFGQEAVVQDALAVSKYLQGQFGRMPTDPEVAKELDAQYEKHYRELVASHPRLAASQAGQRSEAPNGAAPQPGAVESVNAVAPKAPTTLTNGGSAVRASPGRRLTGKALIDAAAELMPDPPRPRGF
jgi:hypothetical protein